MRPSREEVARWNGAYSEQTAALFAAMRADPFDVAAIRRLARAYRELAQAWRALSADQGAPLWARNAAAVAAQEFESRSAVENYRADLATHADKGNGDE
jgi:hypothetical protein